MGKRATKTYAHSSEVYKQPTARKAVLIVGFVVSLVALAFAVVVLLSFFTSGVGGAVEELFGKPLLEAEKLLCWIGIGASIVGTILSVAGANAVKPIAHLSFLFTVLSFFSCIAILVFSYLGMFLANIIA